MNAVFFVVVVVVVVVVAAAAAVVGERTGGKSERDTHSYFFSLVTLGR